MLVEPQAFAIPYPPRVDFYPTRAGWSIWAPTALDWHLLRGLLPARRSHCPYHCPAHCHDHCHDHCPAPDHRPDSAAERLLEECRWAEEWV